MDVELFEPLCATRPVGLFVCSAREPQIESDLKKMITFAWLFMQGIPRKPGCSALQSTPAASRWLRRLRGTPDDGDDDDDVMNNLLPAALSSARTFQAGVQPTLRFDRPPTGWWYQSGQPETPSTGPKLLPQVPATLQGMQ